MYSQQNLAGRLLAWAAATVMGGALIMAVAVTASAGPPSGENVNVTVAQSDGSPLAGVQINYKCDGSTLLYGTTDSGGGVHGRLPDGSECTFTAIYRGTSDQQDVTVDGTTVVHFQTSAVTVSLSDHTGAPLAGGAAAYKSGSTTYWLNPNSASVSTTDATGAIVGQLFDGTYDFRMQYNAGTQWKTGITVSGNTTVAFQTGLLSIVYSNDLSYGQGNPNAAWFTKSGTELLPGTYDFHPRGIGYPANSGCASIPITSPTAGTTATKTIIAAQLVDSYGDPLSGGVARYTTGGPVLYLGSATDAYGSACQVVNGALADVTVSMSYRNTSSSKTQDVTTNSIFAFQTSAVTVTLADHSGGPLAGGSVAYRPWDTTGTGTWLNPNSQSVSTTDATGAIVGQLFDGTYDFRMQYNAGTQWKEDVTVSGNTTVAFQTGLLSIVYRNPAITGNDLSYGGNKGDSVFFTKSGTELLPGSYNFHPRGVGYPAGTGCWPISIDLPDTFAGTAATKTIIAAQLTDSYGDPLAGGQGYWQTTSSHFLGSATDATGSTCQVVDGALGNVEAWMKYGLTTSAHATQDVTTNSIFTFQTSAVTVTLSDHTGASPLNGGVASYKLGSTTVYLNGTSGASTTGATGTDGAIVGQLFDGTYDFRMQYNAGTQWKTGITVSGATTVAFQTGLLSIVYSNQLSYGQGNPDSAFFTKSGTELLPGTYDFHPRGVGYPANSGCASIPITSPAAGTMATKTIIAAQLTDSSGDPLAGGQAHYRTGGPDAYLGSATDATGSTCQVVDGALGSVEVWMSYGFTTSAHTTQDVTTNSIFTFQTSAVTVTLADGSGDPLAGGVAAYRSGSVTVYLNGTSAASTTDATGTVVGQLFDGTYDFRMGYGGLFLYKYGVPVSGSTLVAFQPEPV